MKNRILAYSSHKLSHGDLGKAALDPQNEDFDNITFLMLIEEM